MENDITIKYYPDRQAVDKAMQEDDPLLILVTYDSKEILISNIDDSFEHIILLKNLGYQERDLDKFFRVIVNREGADWTFVCPSNYKNIVNKEKRIETFYKDGIIAIAKAIQAIGYDAEINIPPRYRRHFNLLS